MLLLDIHSPMAPMPMPVPGFLNQSERAVPEQQEENLEAIAAGAAYPPHEYAVASTFIYAVGPANGDKSELYAVRIEGSPRTPSNKAFVTAARKLLSYDDDEAHPQDDRLDFDPEAGPPRPAVIRALTAAVTMNNGTGKQLPHIIAL